MKTFVVLSALAAVAIAAPALLEEGSTDFKHMFTDLPELFTRERKSPAQESSTAINPTPGAPRSLPSTSQISEIGVSGRTFGLKKPIIIKKKQGYHVYRDSDEEQFESGETCGKQVKVKLCDVKSDDMMRSATIEDPNIKMTEEDMKQSIKLAKEAVENLQRDLKKIEHKPNAKTTAWKHGHSESDAELHQDIEVAREALEHIHKNFGNLESMSLHATTPEDADTTQVTVAKTEEERLAQWKEAMETIQKNVEIARNIEDSFKAVPGEAGLAFSHEVTDETHEVNKNTNIVRATEEMETKEENKDITKECKSDAHEKSSEKDNPNSKLIENDMTSSASTISEKKTETLHNTEKARHATGLPTDNNIDKALRSDKIHNEKNAESETMAVEDHFQPNNIMSDLLKTTEDDKERKTEPEGQEKISELVKNTDSTVASSVNQMKSTEAEDMLLDFQRSSATKTHDSQSQKTLKNDIDIKKMERAEINPVEMKSADKESKLHETQLHLEQAKDVDTSMFVKSAEQVLVNTEKESPMDNKHETETAHKSNSEHQFTEPKMARTEDFKQQTETLKSHTNIPVHSHQRMQSMLHPEMRAAEDMNMHHHFANPPHTRWAEDKNLNFQMDAMKSADGIHSMDHTKNIQHAEHHHHMEHAMKAPHHFDPNSHGHIHPHHSRIPDNFMQGKSADMDMAYYMNMRDGSDGQRFRWKPTHEEARTAYGISAAPAIASSSSGGAVGLFPNANVGGCGIPLLLSCNPSVVSGSLAKAHTAPYSAPAYRSDDDFNFHAKRDVKKSHENLPNPLHKTPTNVKTSTVLVAKQ